LFEADGGEVGEGCLVRRLKRRAMPQEGREVCLLVDSLDAHDPAAGAEVATIPRELSRPTVQELIPQSSWILLIIEFQNIADWEQVESGNNVRAPIGRREGAGVERGNRAVVGHGEAKFR
jgi:hypothetical protein